MTASIKEALEQASAMLVCLSRRYTISENHKIRFTGKWSHMGEISLGEVLDNANTALASLESGEARERIARIIDPGSFYIRDESNGLMCTVECNGALAAADAILASGLAPNESAIRADERERCAKIAEDMHSSIHDHLGSVARNIAAAIRAGRGEG